VGTVAGTVTWFITEYRFCVWVVRLFKIMSMISKWWTISNSLIC